LVRNTQQFAIFTEESRFSVNTCSIAYIDDFVIREFDEVILFVVHHNSLCALAGSALAVKSSECAHDGAFVTNSIKLAVVHRVCEAFLTQVFFGRIKAAVVVHFCFAIYPKGRIKVFTGYCHIERRLTYWLQSVLNGYCDLALIVHWCAVRIARDISVVVQLVHAQDNHLCCIGLAAVKLDRV